MVPEWIMQVIEWLAYQLICRYLGHKAGAWFPANGPEGTKARMCSRCLRGQHLIGGTEYTPWTR